MLQTKFSIKESQADFLNNFKSHGFKDKSAMLRTAIDLFKNKLEDLKRSADLYAEIYSEDEDLKELTDAAAAEWPE
jgi:hypothetical protein